MGGRQKLNMNSRGIILIFSLAQMLHAQGPSESPTTSEASEIPSTDIPSTEISSTDFPSTEISSTVIGSTEIPSTEIPSTEISSTVIGSVIGVGVALVGLIIIATVVCRLKKKRSQENILKIDENDVYGTYSRGSDGE